MQKTIRNQQKIPRECIRRITKFEVSWLKKKYSPNIDLLNVYANVFTQSSSPNHIFLIYFCNDG